MGFTAKSNHCWLCIGSSGMRWAKRSRRSIMKWHGGRDNYICRCIQDGTHGITMAWWKRRKERKRRLVMEVEENDLLFCHVRAERRWRGCVKDTSSSINKHGRAYSSPTLISHVSLVRLGSMQHFDDVVLWKLSMMQQLLLVAQPWCQVPLARVGNH